MIKIHKKEQRIKFQPEKKEENRIFSPEEKSMFTFFVPQKRNWHMIKRAEGIRHTGDCLRDFWIKTFELRLYGHFFCERYEQKRI